MYKSTLIFLISLMAQVAYSQNQWNPSGTNIMSYTAGKVGIGTSTPGATLDVQGNLLFLTGSNQLYVNGGYTADGTRSGIRSNGGSVVFNASNTGKLYLNRDVNADTWIESTPDGVNNIEIATFKSNGFVGINTTTPRTTLDVNGSFYLNRPGAMVDAESTIGIPAGSYLGMAPSNMSASNDAYMLFLFPDNNSFRIGSNYDGRLGSPLYRDIQFGRYSGDPYLTIKDGGNVLIGKTSQTNTGYMLDVNGNARMNQVVVNATGADFVFGPSYRLPSLQSIDKYIQTNHHLPGIAPAVQMQTQGVDLGENQTRMLQKIEELTLYVIEQNKKIETLTERVKALENKK